MGPLAKIDAIDGKKWVKFVAMQQQCKLNLLFTCNDVSGNCFCTSLLHTKFTCHIMQRACMLRSKVNNYRQMAIAMTFTLHGFNDLGHSVTPIFFDASFSLPIFYVLQKNEKKNLCVLSRSLNILQNGPSNSVYLTSSISCGAVSNASLRVKVCENDGNI